ncbi:hypothetical protein B0H14DRAFT_3460616 [Mycena olivaceomarginata]|nr:hypothetical protein B0H14DRAFT_3460616 [Mycena olivaceomarginata]
MGISDEFQPAIVDSIPRIVALLTDNDSNVRRVGADTLAKLLEKDEFRPAIVVSTPKIVVLLTDNRSDVRSAGADALAKLSEKADLFNPLALSRIQHLLPILLLPSSYAASWIYFTP